MIILDGRSMLDKDRTHKYLKEKFDFPDYYGGNLDALWDLLVDEVREQEIYLINKNILINNLGNYGEILINTFNDLNKEFNKNIFKILY